METFKEKALREWNAFRAMSFRKKLEHIRLYYQWHLIVLAAAIAIIVSWVQMSSYNNREQLISGVFVNTATSEEGYAYLRDGYWEACGSRKNTRVELQANRPITFYQDYSTQTDVTNFMIVSSLMAARDLDYIITDAASLDFFESEEVTTDLRTILPESTLSRFHTYERGTGIIAIGLEGTAFASKFPLTGEESCVLVVNNARDMNKIARFLDYLLAE